MSENLRDVLALLVTLLLLPFIVHMLHAPMVATLCVAIVCWPVAWVGVMLIIIEGSKRDEVDR